MDPAASGLDHAQRERSMTDPTPIAWRAIVYGTPVLAGDGAQLGRVREVLGSDADDIFHGLRVGRGGDSKRDIMVAAERITGITRDSISTNVAGVEEVLPAYDEEATYHLASVGWLRKHLGWVKDADRDEESG
jgi:uncharacterized protein YrrD